MIVEASYYEKINGGRIICHLCPHNCKIGQEKYGLCRARYNDSGILKSLNYGEISSIAKDPIEKKPLFHFKPGTKILSVGSFGCSFGCDFCQNYKIAKEMPETKYLKPIELVDLALDIDENIGIAFTYNEPFVWYEYILECSKELKRRDESKSVVLVTNGFVQKEPLEEILPYIDAMNIDLKSYQNSFYENICKGKKQPVLETIKRAYGKCHIEITTLLVNGLNDSNDEVEKISEFIASIDKDIVLHLSRYFPAYKMNIEKTPINRLIEARIVAQKNLSYVYLGNVENVDNNTYCKNCGELIIKRGHNYSKIEGKVDNCAKCGVKTTIIR